MQRSIEGLLVVVLLLLIYHNGRLAWDSSYRAETAVHAGERGPVVPRLLRPALIAPLGDHASQSTHAPVIVDFGADMVPASELEQPVDSELVVVEPRVDHTLRWISPSRLEVAFGSELERAARYYVHLREGLQSLAGRRVLAEEPLEFATDPVRLKSVAIAGDDPMTDRSLLVRFDIPVLADDLPEFVKVVEPGGRRLHTKFVKQPEADTHAWRIDLSPPDGHQEMRVPERVEFVLEPGLRPFRAKPSARDVATAYRVQRRISFVDPLLVRGSWIDDDGIVLQFNRVISLPDRSQFEVVPKRDFQVVQRHNQVRLACKLDAGTTVAVRMRKGFPGHGRARLIAGVRKSFRIPDKTPSLEFAHSGRVLSALAEPEIEVRGVNVERMRVSLRQLYPNNLVRFAQDGLSVRHLVLAPPITRRIEIDSKRNQTFTHRIDLDAMLPDDTAAKDTSGNTRRGAWLISLQDLDGHGLYERRVVQLTDIGLTMRSARGSVAVRCASLAKGSPLPWTELRLLTPTNQELARGLTDANGVAVLRFVERGSDRVPFLLEAKKGNDRCFIDLDDYRVELSDDSLGGAAYLESGSEAWVWTERGVCRPGGTVRATCVVRDATGDVPLGRRFELSWVDPSGRVHRKHAFGLEPDGLATDALVTEPTAPSGVWKAVLVDVATKRRVGSTRFRIESFVPDRLEAEVALVEDLRFGREGRARVNGNWLDGSPAARRPVRVFVRLDRGRFAPQAFRDFSFEADRGAGAEQPPIPGAQPAITAALDETGQAVVRFPLPENVPGWQTLTANLVAEVSDPSGRVVRATSSAPVLHRDFHVGVRRTAEGRGEVVLVTPEETLFSDPTSVRIEVVRRHYSWKRVDAGGSRYRYQTTVASQLAQEQTLDVPAGRGYFAYDEPASDFLSWYVLVAKVGDRVAETPIGPLPQRPDRLRVTADATRVEPGKTAEVGVDSPVAARAFVTLEGTRIWSTQTQRLEAGHNRVEVAIPEGVNVPNLHLVVTATRAQAHREGPFFLVGGASIPIAAADRTGQLEVEVADTVRPETVVAVTIQSPTARRALVALVDEGILRLTGHPSPDPLGFFLRQRRLDSRGADTGMALLGGARFSPEIQPGGDGDSKLLAARLAGSINQRIRTVALFHAPVELDGEGRAVVRFQLPEYEGRLRAMVVAAGTRTVAAVSKPVTVKAPLGLDLAGPRILAPGDESRIVVTLRNGTSEAGDVDLRLSTKHGLLLADSVPEQRSVRLTAGERTAIEIPFVASSALGDQGLEVTARLGREHRVSSFHVKVRPLAQFEVARTGIVLEPGSGKIELNGHWVEGTLQARIVLDKNPEAGLLPALESVVGYPYGCVEQTTSKGFALLGCRGLLSRLAAEGNPPELSTLIDRAIDRLLTMQTYSGGLAMWPGGERPYRFGSIYALDFLLTCGESGFAVPEHARRKLIDYVARLLSAGGFGQRCHAAEVLSRAGHPVGSWVETLVSELGDSPGNNTAESRALLALAAKRLGRDKIALSLLEAGPAQDVDRERGGMLRSALRARSVFLRALLEVRPADARIPGLADVLVRASRKPRVLTTQELGQALRSLSRYYAVSNPDTAAPANVSITIAGKRHVVDGELRFAPGLERVLEYTATGRCYGQLVLSGHRLDGTATSHPLLTVKRRILDIETHEPATEFKKGRVYEVELTGNCVDAIANLLLTDVVPGGFELENPRLRVGETPPRGFRDARYEIRDDRVLIFPNTAQDGQYVFGYRMRAVFPGRYRASPPRVEALYDPSICVRGSGGKQVEIRR